MSSDNGFNPMRWDCAKQGCFNRKKRPKIELFADCFPRRIAFSDVDGIVEVKGNFLALEWKEHQRLPKGQKILFERFTSLCPATVIIVEGNAETMTVDTIRVVWDGVISPPEGEPAEPCDLQQLKELIAAWATWANDHIILRADRKYHAP